MKLRSLLKMTGLLAVGALMGIAATSTANAGEKIRWKMHSAYGSQIAVIGKPAWRISEIVSRMSDGDFDIKVFEPGALAGGYAYFDPVGQGAFEMAFGTPGANQGKNSAYSFLSSFPFGPSAPEFVSWYKYGGGVEIAEELYARDNIKYMFCGMIAPETSGWFREPITNLDQLKGLKMRFFGVGAKVMQKLGVSTQQLPGGDIYPALELGTIDATEFSMPAIDRSFGFYQIAKYNYFPGWHQQSTATELLINMDKWNALPDSYQAMLEAACDQQFTYMLAEGEALQFQAMLDNEADGVTNMVWPDEVLDVFRAKWKEVLGEELEANEDVRKLWDSYTTFHDNYVVWGDRAYLK